MIGFASWPTDKRRAAAKKGGKRKVPKGFALLNKDELRRLSAKGGRISRKRKT